MNKKTVLKIVENTICKHHLAEEKAHIILGLSGGPDSVCLFDVLLKLGKTHGYVLHAVHVNHQLRGDAAMADQKFVEELCSRTGVDCNVVSVDCAALARELGVSEEEAGRKIRYDAFAKRAWEIADSSEHGSCIKIAVAHNSNDQAETVLMRIIRGTGISGLRGMEYCRMDECGFEIIRPLLDVKREDIEEYCSLQNLSPCTDATNSKPLYNRNKVRLELIPHIDSMFDANVTDSLVRLSAIACEDDEFIESVAGEIYEESKLPADCSSKQFVKLKLETVKNSAKPVQKRIILRAMKESGLSQDMTGAHVEAAVKLVEKATVSSRLDFPHGFGIRIGYDDIEIGKLNDSDGEKECVTDSFVLMIDDGKSENRNRLSHSIAAEAIFDYDKLRQAFGNDFESRLELRTRREGDFICIDSSGNTKKLKKYFIDEKVPSAIRDAVPLIAVGSEILFVAGTICWAKNRYSGRYKVDKETAKTTAVKILSKT